MEKSTLIEFEKNKQVTYSWDYERLYLYTKVEKLENSDELRTTLMKQCAYLESKNGRNVIMEFVNLPKLSLEDQFFISYVFIPEMCKSGLKYMAVVSSYQNLLEKLFIDNIKGSLEKELVEFEFFDSVSDAEYWLTHN